MGKYLIIFVLTLVFAGGAYGVPGDVWDLADDFTISAGNPHVGNGATWDYQYRTSSGAGPTSFAGTRVNNRAPGGGGAKTDMPPNIAWVPDVSGAESAVSLMKYTADADPNNGDLTVYKTSEIGGHAITGAQWFAPADGRFQVDFSGFHARNVSIGRDLVLRIVRPDNTTGTWTIDDINNVGSDNAVVQSETFTMTAGQQVTVEIIPISTGDFAGMSMTVTEVEIPQANLTINVSTDPAAATDPNEAYVGPHVGTQSVPADETINLSAARFAVCPEVLDFVRWSGPDVGLVADPNSPNTSITMASSDAEITVEYEDVRQCGDECHPIPSTDASDPADCIVNFDDLSKMSFQWLDTTNPADDGIY